MTKSGARISRTRSGSFRIIDFTYFYRFFFKGTAVVVWLRRWNFTQSSDVTQFESGMESGKKLLPFTRMSHFTHGNVRMWTLLNSSNGHCNRYNDYNECYSCHKWYWTQYWTSCRRTAATICLRPLQVDNIFVFIRQVAPIPARYLFKTSASAWPLDLETGVRVTCKLPIANPALYRTAHSHLYTWLLLNHSLWKVEYWLILR